MNKPSKTSAIVVCAGTGQRMGTDKAMMILGDKPLFAWSVDVFQKCDVIDEIIIVLHSNNIAVGNSLVQRFAWDKVATVCAGGKLRQDSVRNALKHVKDSEWVIIHDGARPFVTDKLIREGIKAARQTGAAVPAIQVKDTVKLADDNEMVQQTLERKRLRAVQTPQIFRFDIIVRAYTAVNTMVTDDASLVEQAGFKVRMYSGDYDNIKITTPEDLLLAEMIMRRR